jgi:hypothetical protein
MNKPLFAILFTLIASSASAQHNADSVGQLGGVRQLDKTVHAPMEDSGYAKYRRVVFGDTDAVPTSAPIQLDAGSQWVPGSYARYLMNNGMPRSEALAQATLIGESLTRVANEPGSMSPQLSPYELYQRAVQGRTNTDIERSRSAAMASSVVVLTSKVTR